MTKIDIVSGFLGAGKTTLIKKMLKEALADTNVVLIENEFGEIGVDSGFLKETGIEIREMNSGCICCSLAGDFGTSLAEVLDRYHPERILIEPSGVGKLSDVMKAVQEVEHGSEVALNSAVAVVDAAKCKMYLKNFGEFFINQIEYAGTIILSRTADIKEEKLNRAIELIRRHNRRATIITTPWDQLDGRNILDTVEGASDLEEELMQEVLERGEHQHGHGECGCHGDHEHDHGGECGCHGEHNHEHEHGEECGCHGEHNHGHEHGEECGCHGEHNHEHEHGEECGCGCHDHDDHGHHHADEVFTSWGMETPAMYTAEEIEEILEHLEEERSYGMVLRAKGMVPSRDGTWIYFDYVPGESEVRTGKPDVTGKLCVIGSGLHEDRLALLFAK